MSVKTHTGNEGIRESDGLLFVGLIIRRSIRQQNLTIGTSAVAIPTTALSNRRQLFIFNNSTGGQILYIGDNTVSSTNGFPLYPRASISIAIEDGITVYGISSAAGADIRICEGA